VTILDVYGALFFAGARNLERLLPAPNGSHRPAVVLRLRGRERAAATLIEVLTNYATELAKAGGRLYISGLGTRAREQLTRTHKLPIDQNVSLYPATDVVGESTDAAVEDARRWLRGDED
jgi:sulfate permease, SulP family